MIKKARDGVIRIRKHPKIVALMRKQSKDRRDLAKELNICRKCFSGKRKLASETMCKPCLTHMRKNASRYYTYQKKPKKKKGE